MNDIHNTTLYNKALACLYGGFIGDAMGSPTENKSPQEIRDSYGWLDDFDTGGTDDTILRGILADSLIETDGYATLDDWAAHWMSNWDSLFGTKSSRFWISVLHTAHRLRVFEDPRRAALGNIPCSSAAMSMAPVGIVNACNPKQAASQAYNLASLINIHDAAVSQDGAAAMAGAVAEAFDATATVHSVIEAAKNSVYRHCGQGFIEAISLACDRAQSEGTFEGFRDEVYSNPQKFLQAKKMNVFETIPITLALFQLAEGDCERTITYAANFGRDADTMASMGGAIAGAYAGMGGMPDKWVTKAREYADVQQEEIARRLCTAAIRKLNREETRQIALRKLIGG